MNVIAWDSTTPSLFGGHSGTYWEKCPTPVVDLYEASTGSGILESYPNKESNGGFAHTNVYLGVYAKWWDPKCLQCECLKPQHVYWSDCGNLFYSHKVFLVSFLWLCFCFLICLIQPLAVLSL